MSKFKKYQKGFLGWGDTNAVTLVGGYVDNIKNVSEIKKVDNVSIKAFPCPKVNDAGLTGAWWWANLIAIAVTVWATSESYKAAKKEYEIGKRYYQLAKDQWDHFYNNYRPLEDQELAEIWNEQPYKPDYDNAIRGHTNLTDKLFSNADKHRQALMAKYCLCNDVSQFTKTENIKSIVKGDSDNFARRYAEKLAQEKNDLRWNKRIAAMARGRNILNQAASFASKAASLYGEYAKAMGGLANQAAQFSGYVQNRFRTTYNPVRDRIDGRADLPDIYMGDQNRIGMLKAINYYSAAPVGGYYQGGQPVFSYGGNSAGEMTTLNATPNTFYTATGFDPTGYSNGNVPAT